MRLVVITPEFLPIWGGAGTYIVDLVRHLPEYVDVHVVTPLREGFGKSRSKKPYSSFSEYFGSNVHVHFVCEAQDTFFYNARFQLACMRYVPELVRKEKIDLVHVCHHMAALTLEMRKSKVPMVTTIHNTIKDQRDGTRLSGAAFSSLEFSERATYLSYPLLRMVEMAYFLKPRLYITVSKWMRQHLQETCHVAGNVLVIPNSVEVDNKKTGESTELLGEVIPERFAERRIVLFVGRLLAMKGVYVLAKAIPQILRTIRDDKPLFVFAGPGDPSGLLNILRKEGNEADCLFTGPLPREKVGELMAKSKVVMVPSLHENLPYTVLESMACGTPVVASSVGGIPEAITDNYNGMLVEPGSPEALVEAATFLLQDDLLRNRLGKHARETIISNFSWEANLPKYLNAYSRIIS